MTTPQALSVLTPTLLPHCGSDDEQNLAQWHGQRLPIRLAGVDHLKSDEPTEGQSRLPCGLVTVATTTIATAAERPPPPPPPPPPPVPSHRPDGFIDRISNARRFAVHAFDGRRASYNSGISTKPKPWATTVTIHHDLGRRNGAKVRKALIQGMVIYRVGEIADVKFLLLCFKKRPRFIEPRGLRAGFG